MISTPPQDRTTKTPQAQEPTRTGPSPEPVGHLFDVGGDDPDFFLAGSDDKTPLICRVPGLRSIAPHCR